MWEPQVYIPVIVVAIFTVCVAIAAFTIYMILRRKKTKLHHGSLCNKSVDLELQQLSLSIRTVSENKVSFESSSQKVVVVMESFTVEELTAATADFCSSNLIKGSVYHGRLNGKNLAIKRTDHFTISNINFELLHDATHFHPNLIRLLGSCTGDEESGSVVAGGGFLVFEYAKNGSLKDWIHGGLAIKSHFIASCYCFLTWNQRLRICLDIATALQYMHQIMNPNYVHKDIKSRNIFLDEDFNAKIGNFGMEECVKNDHFPKEVESSSSSSWDRGYIAPELLGSSAVDPAPSTDIYAFGVVLLEILSGKPPVSSNKSESEEEGGVTVLLSEKIKFILRSSTIGSSAELNEFMDNMLGEKYSFDAAITLVTLARACVEDDPMLRPNAGEIVQKLSKLVAEFLPELGEEEEQIAISESSCKPLVIKNISD
ncbi:unnamed protein product [Lactuca virosa]|uniref:Protein kinase domain-containing protein n=1 Tax=Lactuca virosa TaxID=75947 RepID=A0AAU9MHP0_9ASTR|nr:unnamed protein product [Lactuca virosa]